MYRCFDITLELDSSSAPFPAILQKLGGKPCVPGPTLKGALRNEIEEWIISLYRNNKGKPPPEKMRPCIPATQLSEDERKKIGQKDYREACGYDEESPSPVCPVCYILGAQGLVGFVSVPFLVLAQQRPPRFQGTLKVLWEDAHKGWKFGEKRPVEGNVDAWLPLGDNPEALLKNFVLDRLKAIRQLGSERSPLQVKISVTERTV